MAMPEYIESLIVLADRVCMNDRVSPRTLLRLLRRYKYEYLRDFIEAKTMAKRWPEDDCTQEYKKATLLDLTRICKACCVVKKKISIRGF